MFDCLQMIIITELKFLQQTSSSKINNVCDVTIINTSHITVQIVHNSNGYSITVLTHCRVELISAWLDKCYVTLSNAERYWFVQITLCLKFDREKGTVIVLFVVWTVLISFFFE